MTILLANLMLAHIAAGPISWSLPDEYLSLSVATMLFHVVAACLPWFVWRWYRHRPRILLPTSIQALLSGGFVFAFWWP
ncbi:MAG: hypothetical protein OYG32_08250 [Rhodospirillaceae bacterium]|nr:hypothetical protein [Rhodospirillaceae bacterium]MDE0254771.1 hypothetical protein [Rhodospirillaceae bacterium]MDE0616020.1 hypothetical protein [Rhodospirillaceae bacterium]